MKSTKRERTRSHGRLMDTVQIEVDGAGYEVEVRTKRDEYGNYRHAALHIVDDEILERAVGDTPEEAEKEIHERLKERYHTDWEDFIHIRVTTGHGSWIGGHGKSKGLAISIGRVQVGTTPAGAKRFRWVHLHTNGEWRPDGTIHNGEPVQGIGQGYHERDTSYGLIPFDHENWEKLNSILAAVSQLRNKVQDFLTGDDAQAIAARLSTVAGMLPAPEKRPDDDDDD